jgi:hypothetical protein
VARILDFCLAAAVKQSAAATRSSGQVLRLRISVEDAQNVLQLGRSSPFRDLPSAASHSGSSTLIGARRSSISSPRPNSSSKSDAPNSRLACGVTDLRLGLATHCLPLSVSGHGPWIMICPKPACNDGSKGGTKPEGRVARLLGPRCPAGCSSGVVVTSRALKLPGADPVQTSRLLSRR